MEYLQYRLGMDDQLIKGLGFKPYYKWNTFNTFRIFHFIVFLVSCFKPYYKWNTFNTS